MKTLPFYITRDIFQKIKINRYWGYFLDPHLVTLPHFTFELVLFELNFRAKNRDLKVTPFFSLSL